MVKKRNCSSESGSRDAGPNKKPGSAPRTLQQLVHGGQRRHLPLFAKKLRRGAECPAPPCVGPSESLPELMSWHHKDKMSQTMKPLVTVFLLEILTSVKEGGVGGGSANFNAPKFNGGEEQDSAA